MVQHAITAELDRGGQVYYVHNRIESIYGVARALEQLVPKARIAVGHGQMHEHELEPIMSKFIDGEIDVFVSTTIIENGIDIPNVNTIIVHDADKFGLAQLYQLRGRVGRSNHQAYAFLLYQAHKALSEDAKARLEAIREFTHLGSGLQIAMRDLEIRGAGNLLGAAQSGFIGAVGFETYAQLLAEAITARKGAQAAADARETVIDVKLDAFVPNDYIPQVSQKIAVYQQLAAARTLEGVEDIVASVRDRFGPLPEPFENLAEITRLRVLALKAGVTRVVINEQRLTLGVGSGFVLDPAAIPQLQSITKNKFRFGEGKITIDLPARTAAETIADAARTAQRAEPAVSDNVTSHVEESIEAVADLEREAHEATSRHHRWIERVTSRIGRPLSFYIIVTFVVLWIASNSVALHTTGSTFDPPPFSWLQGMVSLSGLLVAILILITANRVAQIDSQRDKLDLQINLLNERRTAKLIRMLDELRRDSPEVPTHEDPEVDQLSEHTDTQEVSRAIEERTPQRPGT